MESDKWHEKNFIFQSTFATLWSLWKSTRLVSSQSFFLFSFHVCLKCEAKQATSASSFASGWLRLQSTSSRPDLCTCDHSTDRTTIRSLIASHEPLQSRSLSRQRNLGRSHRRISATAYPTLPFYYCIKSSFISIPLAPELGRVFALFCVCSTSKLWQKCKFFRSFFPAHFSERLN